MRDDAVPSIGTCWARKTHLLRAGLKNRCKCLTPDWLEMIQAPVLTSQLPRSTRRCAET